MERKATSQKFIVIRTMRLLELFFTDIITIIHMEILMQAARIWNV